MIEILTTAEGTTFVGYPNDYLFDLLKQGNTFPDDYVKTVIDQCVKPDSVCVDVGANLGYVTLYMAKRCKEVHSFEPQPVVFLQLCANVFLNQRLNVKAYQMGLCDCETTLEFASYQSGWVGAKDFSDYSKIGSIGSISFTPGSGTIPARRLDTVIKSKVDFIKIDAQGADIDVIFGAQDILAKYRPVIVFEYEYDLSVKNYHRCLDDLVPYLDKLGYKSEEIYPGNYLLTPQ